MEQLKSLKENSQKAGSGSKKLGEHQTIIFIPSAFCHCIVTMRFHSLGLARSMVSRNGTVNMGHAGNAVSLLMGV